MEENLKNNQQPIKERPKKQEPSTEKKKKKAKAAVITLSTVVVLFLGLQVYASVNGYGNVFFMIKNLITTGNPAGNQEIFSDKDINLSYKSIELAEGLKIQANRLEIKDGKTKILLSVKSQNGELLPLKYEVTTKNNEGNETTTTTKITGTRPENTDLFEYEDVITLDYEVQENKIIVLKIKDSSDKELRTLEINLQTREITVKGEKEFEKISQIELRKYLDLFSVLNTDLSTDDALINIATKFQNNYEDLINKETFDNAKKNLSNTKFINAIIKEFYGENAKFETLNSQEKLELKNAKAYAFSERYGYMAITEGSEIKNGHCLKIEDVKFEDDIYTVKYIYLLATENDEDAEKLEELPQYETTIKLKRKEDNLYSKYEIVSIEKGTEVKNKVSANVEENNSEVLDNSHDQHYYSVVEHSGTKGSDGGHTTLDGTHIERCVVCNEERRVPHNFGKWFKIRNSSGEIDAYTLWCNDCKDYIYTSDYNVVKNSGYGINEEETNTNEQTSSNVWKEFNTLNNARIKMPENFISLNEKYDYERYKTQYFEGAYFGGKIKVKYDVTLSSNMYPGSEVAKSYLGNNEERMVESKDDNGWTNWYPISDASRMLDNGFERKYGRVGNGQFEEVTFTYDGIYSCGLEQYKFMSDVLSSVNSRGIN